MIDRPRAEHAGLDLPAELTETGAAGAECGAQFLGIGAGLNAGLPVIGLIAAAEFGRAKRPAFWGQCESSGGRELQVLAATAEACLLHFATSVQAIQPTLQAKRRVRHLPIACVGCCCRWLEHECCGPARLARRCRRGRWSDQDGVVIWLCHRLPASDSGH